MNFTSTLSEDSIKTHCQNIESEGYSVIKGYVDLANAAKLNALADDIFLTKRGGSLTAAPVGRQKVIANDPIVSNVLYYSEEFLNLVTSGDHLKVYQWFLNDRYYGLIDQSNPNFMLAQCNLRKGATAIDYHIDVRMNFEGPLTWSMQGILALDHRNRYNGGLKVIPGSHRQSGFPSDKTDKSSEIFVDLEPGDMAIFHSTLFHATTPVTEGYDPTWGLLLTYRSWWCKPQYDYVRMLPAEMTDKLTNAQKTLIGFHSLPPSNPEASPSLRIGYA